MAPRAVVSMIIAVQQFAVIGGPNLLLQVNCAVSADGRLQQKQDHAPAWPYI
jgi:hypothetical protein